MLNIKLKGQAHYYPVLFVALYLRSEQKITDKLTIFRLHIIKIAFLRWL